mmetsp:Transcript_45726/g.110803  ORF Transcript_45726/g.110803 Transcript_45726/m.110803 type:complete len:100 (-) Transcript_45726:32-331(-)
MGHANTSQSIKTKFAVAGSERGIEVATFLGGKFSLRNFDLLSIRRPSLVAQMDSQFHRSLGRMDLAGSVSVYSSTNGEIVKMDVKSQILNFLGSTVIFT